MNFESILFEKKNAIAYVTVNRPKVLNALNMATMEELRAAFHDIKNDASIRVSGTLPNGLTLTPGESVYVTEIFTQRTSIVPFMPLPNTLYQSAYF